MPEKTPRWRQPTKERDALPKERARTESGRRTPTQDQVALTTRPVEPQAYPIVDPGVVDVERLQIDEETPPPMDVAVITAIDAWNHASNVQKRAQNKLLEIAQSSGAGMDVGDRVRNLEEAARATRSDVKEQGKKLKRWQALALSALATAGSSLVGVAKGLYERGAAEGAYQQRIQQMETQAERNRIEIERLREKFEDMPRRGWFSAPATDTKENKP